MHNAPVQLIVPGGAGLLGSPGASETEALRTRVLPSEEWCGMKFENVSKMPTWELLIPESHQAHLEWKPNLSFQRWKLLLLGGVMTEMELAGSCSFL